MYIFGRTYFETFTLMNVFQFAFLFFAFIEMSIWIFTTINNKKQGGKVEKGDKGSNLLLVIGTTVTIPIDMLSKANFSSTLPVLFFWVGIVLVITGASLRAYSVWTLRHFFALSVQVTSDQSIVQTGPYKYLRHPAYTGSILTFIGFALAFRSFPAIIVTTIIIVLIYKYRITVEENMLENSFGEGYEKYEKSTWRVIPFVW